MWAYHLVGPRRIERVEVERPLRPAGGSTVTLAFRAGSICGSDLPCFSGLQSTVAPHHGSPGYPLHEVVGTVVESGSSSLVAGERVVGWAAGMSGLAEVLLADAGSLVPVDDDWSDVDATMVQPLACVLFALSQVDVRDRHVAVVGLGSLGVLFTHVARTLGAARVTGVDLVDRSDVAATFGIDEAVWSHSRDWARGIGPADAPDVVVEAVGHQQGTIADALHAVRPGGTVYAFGVPDDPYYALPYEVLFRKRVTLTGGPTQDRTASLKRARENLRAHPELPAAYLTHRFPVEQAQAAFDTASRPARGRLKVALTA